MSYCNQVATFVFIGEIFPTHIRAKGVTIGLSAVAINAVWVTVATPYGMTNIGWKGLSGQ
jgi:hypothetical protein